jgi:hypothetical protein
MTDELDRENKEVSITPQEQRAIARIEAASWETRKANILAGVFFSAAAVMIVCFVLGNSLLGGLLFIGLAIWAFREIVASG